MEHLPEEIILHITDFLSARSITSLNAVSKRYHDITSDNELWRHRCFDESSSKYVLSTKRTRSQFFTRQTRERRALDLERGLTASSRGNRSQSNDRSAALNAPFQDGATKSKLAHIRQGIANWDCTVPEEEVNWYHEYIARHSPLGLDWLSKPTVKNEWDSEAQGVGLLENGMVLAPLEDGSVCIWDVRGEDRRSVTVKALSLPGLLSKSLSTADLPPIECVSVDNSRNRAYIALGATLVEVDPCTLQVVARHHYPQIITALSEGPGSAPLTVGSTQSLHIHDPLVGSNSEMLAANISKHAGIPDESDFHRLQTGDTDYANLEPLPLSILHTGSHMVHVAGRFPSILNYDRRHFPQITSTVHTSAKISCLASVTSTTSTTAIAAAGEYRSKGSLELYPLSSDTGSLAEESTINRTTTSSSKCLSLAAHGTRLLYSDSDGMLKWVERDCSTPVRRWNVNTNYETRVQPRMGGIFNAEVNTGDVARKLIPVDSSDAKSDVILWTGEKIGVLRFGHQLKNSHDKGKVLDTSDETSSVASDTPSDEERDYSTMMRRALERQADEVRFVQGLGLGRSF